jgi:phage repressor protein C with HTH and peptisase S24 domain
MPASAIPISGRREGVFVILEAVLPGRLPQNIGVLLVDPTTDRGWVRIRGDFEQLAEVDDIEVLEALQDDITAQLREYGAERFLQSLEDSLSNVLRISDRQTVAVDAFTRTIDRLFEEHVAPIAVDKFRTHLPVYSLRAAAGNLGEEMRSEPEGWVRAPEGLRLSEDLFVAHVVGRSMEPRIPDGSLNLFRLHPAGSRQGKILLIERFGVLDETARYTVKRYTSIKKYSSEEEWQHERIRLEPLNPEFEPWDVGPEDFAVVAEWLRVIE